MVRSTASQRRKKFGEVVNKAGEVIGGLKNIQDKVNPIQSSKNLANKILAPAPEPQQNFTPAPQQSLNQTNQNQNEKKEEPKKERFVIDQETGKVSGIRDPITGKVTFLPPKDIAAIQKKEDVLNKVTEIAVQENEKVRAENKQAIAEQAARGIGNPVTPPSELVNFEDRTATDIGLNAGGLLGAVTGGGAGTLIGSALAGAGVGTAAAPVIGTAIGAAIGTIGFVLGRIALARRNVVKRASNSFKESEKSNKYLLNIANQGKTDPYSLVEAYNRNYAVIIAARNELREQVKTKVGASLSGAQEELADIEAYLNDEVYRRQVFTTALTNPNPSLVYNVDIPEVNLNEE